MVYLKAVKVIIVLLVTCGRSFHIPCVTAFIPTAKHGFNYLCPSTVVVSMKHNYLYKLRNSRDAMKILKYSHTKEFESCGCNGEPSELRHPPTNRRREVLRQAQMQVSTLIFASLILGENIAHAQQFTSTEPLRTKTVVITGANSGIGFEACKRLVAKGHTIIMACRSLDKAQDAINRIQQDSSVPMNGKLFPAECDLADMSSIRKFVANVPASTKIDTLCLNAGVARSTAATDCARTKDGFELTGEFCNKVHWILMNVVCLILLHHILSS